MAYKQFSLWPSGEPIYEAMALCWRCKDAFPVNKLISFDCRYTDGHIGTYTACKKCHDIIMYDLGGNCDC